MTNVRRPPTSKITLYDWSMGILQGYFWGWRGRAAEGRPKKFFLGCPFQRFVKKVFWNLESLNLGFWILNFGFWILDFES